MRYPAWLAEKFHEDMVRLKVGLRDYVQEKRRDAEMVRQTPGMTVDLDKVADEIEERFLKREG